MYSIDLREANLKAPPAVAVTCGERVPPAEVSSGYEKSRASRSPLVHTRLRDDQQVLLPSCCLPPCRQCFSTSNINFTLPNLTLYQILSASSLLLFPRLFLAPNPPITSQLCYFCTRVCVCALKCVHLCVGVFHFSHTLR